MTAELEGHVTIVTGAAQGIGRAIAETMASRGARVIVADVQREAGEEVAEAIGATFIATDISSVADVENTVAQTIAAHGRIDSVINNAGITKFVDFFEIEDDHWDRIQQVNLRGAFFFMRAAGRHMREQVGGAFVNISSMAAKGYKHTSSAAYAASKGGVIGLTRAGAMQLAKYRIRVNAVCPGIVITPLNAKWLEENPSRIDEIPLGLPCQPVDIAEAAAFLASDRARTITGQSLNVDGGIVID